jgi:hypothetical protein
MNWKYILIVGLLSFLIGGNIFGVYFATNKIILYEDGKRIKHSLIFHNHDISNPACENGVCYIGQQYDSATFYKTKDDKVLSYSEWQDNWYLNKKGCDTYVTEKYRFQEDLNNWKTSNEYKRMWKEYVESDDESEKAKLWNEISEERNDYMQNLGHYWYYNPECKCPCKDYSNVYFKNLKENAVYSITISLPPPEGGEPAKEGEFFGGRIGNPRTLAVDIKRGTVGEEFDIGGKKFDMGKLLYFISGAAIIVIIGIIVKKILSKKKKR